MKCNKCKKDFPKTKDKADIIAFSIQCDKSIFEDKQSRNGNFCHECWLRGMRLWNHLTNEL